MPEDAKPLKGIAPGVLKIVSRTSGAILSGASLPCVSKGRLRFKCVPEEVRTGHRDADA